MKKETKKLFARGARAGLPVVLSFVPVGIAYGLMAASAGDGLRRRSRCG